ncbi:MAG: acetyl-CoA carboxylase biotin carboxyl carrier protein [Terriglobia bacterium]
MKRKAPKKAKSRGKARSATNAHIPFEQVHALIDMLEERGLEEFELERAGLRIRVKRRGAGSGSGVLQASPGSNPAPTPAPVEPAGGTTPAESGAEPELGENVHLVKSPIVGTFYASPKPGAPPFVQAGDQVQAGQVLCIIEAMKLMNEIEADLAGEILRIYVEDAQPVEYGEPLFALRPHGS